jgi:hypothetical protein
VAGASLFSDARHRGHIASRAVPADDPGAFVAAFRDTFVLVAVLCGLAAIVSLLRPPRGVRLAADSPAAAPLAAQP